MFAPVCWKTILSPRTPTYLQVHRQTCLPTKFYLVMISTNKEVEIKSYLHWGFFPGVLNKKFPKVQKKTQTRGF